jgi:hypothetical protein
MIDSQDRSDTTAIATHAADSGSLDAEMLVRIAREIGASIAADIDQFYPGALTERGLFNVRAWARGEVHKWFGKPDVVAASTTLDQRLRASAAHRRHLKRMRSIAGTVSPGDAIEPIMAAMDASREQARLDYLGGGPVIEGDVE